MYEGQESQDLKNQVKAARKFLKAVNVNPGSPLDRMAQESIHQMQERIRELRIHAHVDYYNEVADNLGEPRTNLIVMERYLRILGKV